MTREEYIIWKAGDTSKFTHDECRAADTLIKTETLRNFNALVAKHVSDMTIRRYLILMVRCHFGSAETDELLTNLNCYPEWM